MNLTLESMMLEIEMIDDEKDRAALALALEQAQAESEERAVQIQDMLADEPWREVAEFAAQLCQRNALKLKPFECPPCRARVIDEAADGSLWAESMVAALSLRDRMTAAGVSIWHPNPVAALKAAESGRAK